MTKIINKWYPSWNYKHTYVHMVWSHNINKIFINQPKKVPEYQKKVSENVGRQTFLIPPRCLCLANNLWVCKVFNNINVIMCLFLVHHTMDLLYSGVYQIYVMCVKPHYIQAFNIRFTLFNKYKMFANKH